MSQSRRKRASNRPVERLPDDNINRDRRGRWPAIIVSVVVILLILIIAGVAFYPTYIAPYRHTVIEVDDASIRMDYFLKRIRLSGADPLNMLSQLTREKLIVLTAPQYGIEISPEDVDEAIKETFRAGSETISENEFREWYRQLLNEIELSDAEYRELVTAGLATIRLQRYLGERLPTIAKQRHLYAIFLETYEEAEEARARWESGEDFSDLARELSEDEQTGEAGGELGWFPRGGVLEQNLEYAAFNIDTGNVTEPIALMGEDPISEGEQMPAITGYYIVLVAEEVSRELDEDALQILKGNVLDGWFREERDKHEILYHGFKNGFDSETYAWVNWQLSKQ